MNVYLANFSGDYFGGSAVVVADSFDEARTILLSEYQRRDLRVDEDSLTLLDPAKAKGLVAFHWGH